MANIIKKVTITEKGLGSGPYYDAYYSPDCLNYYPAISGSVLYLPTIGSSSDVVIDSSAQCIKLINQADKCNYNYKVDTFTTTTTTAGPTTTTTTTQAPAGYYSSMNNGTSWSITCCDGVTTGNFTHNLPVVWGLQGTLTGRTGTFTKATCATPNWYVVTADVNYACFGTWQGCSCGEDSDTIAKNTSKLEIFYPNTFKNIASQGTASVSYYAPGSCDGYVYLNMQNCQTFETVKMRWLASNYPTLGRKPVVNDVYKLDGVCYSFTGFTTAGSYIKTLSNADIYNNLQTDCITCLGTVTTTTTTTTTAAPVWYTLAPCDNPSQTGQYSTSNPSGTFSVGQILVYGTRYFTVTGVNYSDPGGTQWLVVASGLSSCPVTTTTTQATTTLPPLQINQSGAGCSGGAGTVTSTMTGGTGTYTAIAYDNYQSNAAILVNGGAGSGLGQRLTSPTNPNVWTSIPNGTWYFAVKDSGGGISVNNMPVVISCGTTTTTTAAPVLGCYNISYQLIYTTGCNGFGDTSTLYTISLQDQNGNPYVTPTNLTFQFTYDYNDVQDYGGSSGTGTRDLIVYAGHSSGQIIFYTKQYQYCNYATVCDGSCYITETGEYVSYSPIPQC
jgi:hypothetical protein